MRDPILQEVKQFLHLRHQEGRPVLVGFSGGPDSLALLHLVSECRRFFPIDLHVAHVDHGWRPESGLEAKRLEKEVNFPFYLHRLEGHDKSEDGARNERLEFFSKLYAKLGCQALLLGHHRDDQAETVLKRLLEGAHFLSLGGIRPIATLEGMVVWRPLLKTSKKELLSWIEKRGLSPLNDPTNSDPRYLRSRMRVEIFPELAKKFGKEIAGNLSRLGQTAQDLKEYLDGKTVRYFQQLHRSKDGVWIDLNPFFPFEKIEVKAFLKKLSDQESLGLSHEALETLYELLESKASQRKIISREKIVTIHNRVVAIKISSSY